MEAARGCPGLTLHLFTDAERPFRKETLCPRLRAACGRTGRERVRVASCDRGNRDGDKNVEAIQHRLGAAERKCHISCSALLGGK